MTLRTSIRPWEFESPAIEALREHGRIRTDDGIRYLSDGLDDPPKNHAVQRKLLSHSTGCTDQGDIRH